MRTQEKMFHHLPVARKLLVIVGVFVAIVICVFGLGVLRSEILTGVRAYVGGEGLWSKAEKRAVLSLTQYAASHSESDYQRYFVEIAVPTGDKQARLQLQSSSPDMALVREGFVQGCAMRWNSWSSSIPMLVASTRIQDRLSKSS
jgi:hypothetical protein